MADNSFQGRSIPFLSEYLFTRLSAYLCLNDSDIKYSSLLLKPSVCPAQYFRGVGENSVAARRAIKYIGLQTEALPRGGYYVFVSPEGS